MTDHFIKIGNSVRLEEAVTFDDVTMVPRYSEIESRGNVDTTSRLTQNFSIPTPLIAAPMSTVVGQGMMWALGKVDVAAPMHRFCAIENQVEVIQTLSRLFRSNCRESSKWNVPLIGSIGVGNDAVVHAEQLVQAGAEIILIDVAHGDHINVKRILHELNKCSNRSNFDVIAGNIATADAALRLEDWGADALRVGIGGGSMCETRVRTGIGVPQLQSVLDIAEVSALPIISDGGIRSPGDVAKALAAGADTVMIGSLFAGTNESPGEIIVTGEWPNIKTFKIYQGSASITQKLKSNNSMNNVEGTAKLMPVKGPVQDVVETILQGVRSAMSYLGVERTIYMREVVEFIRITHAGLTEAHPHGLGK